MRKVPRLEASCGIPQHTHRSVLLLPGLSKRLRPAVLQRTWKGYALSPSARCDGRSSRLDGQHQERRSMRRLPRGIPRLRDALGPLTRLREGRGREFDGPEPIPGRRPGPPSSVEPKRCSRHDRRQQAFLPPEVRRHQGAAAGRSKFVSSSKKRSHLFFVMRWSASPYKTSFTSLIRSPHPSLS